MTTDRTTATEVERYARGALLTAECLELIATAGTVADVITDDDATETFMEWIADHGIDTDADMHDVLEIVALEVYATGRFSFHDATWTVTGMVIVTGVGGPHIEVEISDTGRIVGRSYWGGDHAEAVGYDADTLFTHLAEHAEEAGR